MKAYEKLLKLNSKPFRGKRSGDKEFYCLARRNKLLTKKSLYNI